MAKEKKKWESNLAKEIKRLYDFVLQYSLAYSDYFKN
jgi:hypothetical protein